MWRCFSKCLRLQQERCQAKLFLTISSAAGMATGGEPEPAPEGSVEITEGRARIRFPDKNQVFYNPAQELNRDLSIAVIKNYCEHLWDPHRFKKSKGPRSKAQGNNSSKGGGVSGGDGVLQGSADVGCCERMEQGVEGVEGGGGGEGSAKAKEGVSGSSAEEVPRDSQSSSKSGEVHTGVRVLEALSASGLRSIRYALEVPQIQSIVCNDLSSDAYQAIKRNVALNGVQDKVTPTCREASMLMYEHRDPLTRFDVVDIDPYGTPAQFLDSVVQSVTDGGLICVTCTDMSVLCGVNPEACLYKYGSTSVRADFCHEMALRIVLSSLDSHANRYHRYIIPLLSVSVDYYIRLFLRVYTSPAEVKKSITKRSMLFCCVGCGSFHLQPLGVCVESEEPKRIKLSTGKGPPVDRLCDQCGSAFRLYGPIWTEPIHDFDFVKSLLGQVSSSPDQLKMSERIRGFLTVISEELPDAPLFHTLDHLCSTVHCTCPKLAAFRFTANFKIRPDANAPSRLVKLARFPDNPTANWGPKARAKRSRSEVKDSSHVPPVKKSKDQ